MVKVEFIQTLRKSWGFAAASKGSLLPLLSGSSLTFKA